jgi:hypothetical protein
MLVLLPLMNVLQTFGWASAVQVPRVFNVQDAFNTLDETLICFPGIYEPLIFCTGVVLLFANERGRRPGHLDWTRRWGILSTYVVFLLSAAEFLFLVALVLAGIAALAQSIALKYQPAATEFLVRVSTTYLYYGPQPMEKAAIVRAAFSSIAILLACVPLLAALRSSGPKRAALVLVAPLALCALAQLVHAGRYGLGLARLSPWDTTLSGVFFWPAPLVGRVANAFGLHEFAATPGVVFVEAVKWCAVLAIATWLTVAQLATWRRRADKVHPAPPDRGPSGDAGHPRAAADRHAVERPGKLKQVQRGAGHRTLIQYLA